MCQAGHRQPLSVGSVRLSAITWLRAARATPSPLCLANCSCLSHSASAASMLPMCHVCNCCSLPLLVLLRRSVCCSARPSLASPSAVPMLGLLQPRMQSGSAAPAFLSWRCAAPPLPGILCDLECWVADLLLGMCCSAAICSSRAASAASMLPTGHLCLKAVSLWRAAPLLSGMLYGLGCWVPYSLPVLCCLADNCSSRAASAASMLPTGQYGLGAVELLLLLHLLS